MMTLSNGPAECLKKSSECLLFFRRQAQRSQLAIEIGVGIASPVVILDYVFEAPDTPVVHVGRGTEHLTQAGRFESAAIFLFAGKAPPGC